MKVYFTDWFQVSPAILDSYGAFNVSLINDLPLFIDPFLLFTSSKPEYQRLHSQIIDYLKFLRDRSREASVNDGLLDAWYMFPEVKQLWLGFSKNGNSGSGMGIDFARTLNENLHLVFQNFGQEQITRGSHLEKVCLIRDGVGRDHISDFTANLIKEYLLEYTQSFAREHIPQHLRRFVSVPAVRFDSKVRHWCSATYELPYIAGGHPFIHGDYVLLTPKDILTKDETWINRHEMLDRLETIARSVSDQQLRSQINEYLSRELGEQPKKEEKSRVYVGLVRRYPELIEWYIRSKEDSGDQALGISSGKVSESEDFYIKQFGDLIQKLETETEFYKHGIDTFEECRARILFLKREIEINGGYRFFYVKGRPIEREQDVQILFRLTWFATPSDFNSEVDNGRGPVDFKISRGNKDTTLVEFKLAKNTGLERNLEKQVAHYQAANQTKKSLKVIFYFNDSELQKVQRILGKLNLAGDTSIILIDCRQDNKPSASLL